LIYSPETEPPLLAVVLAHRVVRTQTSHPKSYGELLIQIAFGTDSKNKNTLE